MRTIMLRTGGCARRVVEVCRPVLVRSPLLLMTLLLALAPLAWTEVSAQTWEGTLQRGGAVTVDPNSRRPMWQGESGARPLWDGVHRLDDGSTVTVRDGIAVPTADMLRAWSGGPVPAPTYAERPCDQLVRKTCGFDRACNTAAACLAARGLLADEAREQQALPSAGWSGPLTAAASPQTATSARCRAALADPAFPACASLESAEGDSRCQPLVLRVCGAADQCAGTAACDAAVQLRSLETDERLASDDPSAAGVTGRQCLEAMTNAFFVACADVPIGAPAPPAD